MEGALPSRYLGTQMTQSAKELEVARHVLLHPVHLMFACEVWKLLEQQSDELLSGFLGLLPGTRTLRRVTAQPGRLCTQVSTVVTVVRTHLAQQAPYSK